MNNKTLLLLLLPVLMLLMGARQAPLVDPSPIAVPDGLSTEQVAKDIKRALITRGWAVAAEQPGHIDATLHLRAHVASIGVDYDTKQVTIAYQSSENLKFEETKKGRVIHKNYLSWIDNLVQDIGRNLQLTALG